jgi:cytochrome c-type protein NapC
MMTKLREVLKRYGLFLMRPSAKYSVLAIASVFFFAGIIFWGGFNTAMEATNKMEFCISCHEMRDTVFQEYKTTIHYANRSGVRAICSDCHVPKDWTHKLWRKIQASKELWGKVTGYIDTPEKFESHRMELATNEWNRMKATNSIECRNCHNFDAMSGALQKQSNYKRHIQAKADGKTCIECHQGIAHKLPREYVDPSE